MPRFTILTSHRTGLNTCVFTVRPVHERPAPGEFFACKDSIGPFEYRIVAMEEVGDDLMLRCFNWILEDGQFVGQTVATIWKSKLEVERYDRAMKKAGVELQSTT